MTIEEIKARYDRNSSMKARFFELHAFTRQELERCGCNRIADLPEEVQARIAELASGVLTPSQIAAEFDALGRECDSLAIVQELRRLYGLPDTRTEN